MTKLTSAKELQTLEDISGFYDDLFDPLEHDSLEMAIFDLVDEDPEAFQNWLQTKGYSVKRKLVEQYSVKLCNRLRNEGSI